VCAHAFLPGDIKTVGVRGQIVFFVGFNCVIL
jgi:hypothetical protein